MKKLLALTLMCFPLMASAELDVEAFAAHERASAAEEARKQPPKHEILARCTFEQTRGVAEVGHQYDFDARSHSPISGSSSMTAIELTLGRWVAGPWYDHYDVKFIDEQKTGLELGWKILTHSTFNNAVHVMDIVMTRAVGDEQVFQQQMLLMIDQRTQPIQAYLTRTPVFSTEDDAEETERVAFSIQPGTCTPVKRQ